MFRGMLVFRIIAAAHVATGFTEAQVHPGIAQLKAFLAAVGIWGYIVYQIEMRAGLLLGHPKLLVY